MSIVFYYRNMGQEPPTAPASFKLIPVKTEKESAPPPAPAPGPHQKPTLDALDRQVLHTVDDHAIQVGSPWKQLELLIKA